MSEGEVLAIEKIRIMSTARLVYGEPGTLYSRCGGVFGISAFVDRCMDRWMADATLNANRLVARWHEKAQRPGFKFFVVQIVCSLTGGPQQYTGRDMATSHKHLNIDEQQWDCFMGIFNDVCSEFGLGAEDVDDLNALMISMMDECVTWPGERPRPDPGLPRPSGNSLYARSGGVYPLALFCDRAWRGLDSSASGVCFRPPAALTQTLTDRDRHAQALSTRC